MTRKIINLDNYVCKRYNWVTAMIPTSEVNHWVDLRNDNQRLWRWVDPPYIDPLRYFFRIDAGKKGWSWSKDLENCYGFLMTYYIDPDLIILSGDEPGGTAEMQNVNSPQVETAGLIPVNWNIPFLADIDKALTGFLESIGLSIPTWIVYVVVGGIVYVKIIK